MEKGALGTIDQQGRLSIHPAFYIIFWIVTSSGVILYNKRLLTTLGFDFPLTLTTWHMLFATILTQVMAHFTSLLASRHRVPMTARKYTNAILPIAGLFSLSLVFGNFAYLYLSVSFIQMLKASNSVVTLLITWLLRMAEPSLPVFMNVCVIFLGVLIASFGEVHFNMIGLLYQIGNILFEALRLVFVQRLLSSAEFKMDPLVSLYYYAPACAAINCVLAAIFESPRLTYAHVLGVGLTNLVANAFVAFLLNVALVLLIGKTSAIVLTMSGVLKDILLVVTSMLFFKDPVTGQQFIGYGVSLAGLTYYRIGGEFESMAQTFVLRCRQFQRDKPLAVRLAALSGIFLSIAAALYWTFFTN